MRSVCPARACLTTCADANVTDFFSVSLSNTRLTTYFDKPLGTITTSITLTLLFRPLGAIIFGLLGDRYGRKYPLIADLLICGVLSLGTAFVKTFPQFLALRSCFGVAMGGIWGLSAATALENMPVEARGFFSGILQQGYAVGYLLSAVINLTEVAKHDNWRVLFYFAAAVSCFAVSLALLVSRGFPRLVDRPCSDLLVFRICRRSSAFSCPSRKPLLTAGTPRRRAEPSSRRGRRVASSSKKPVAPSSFTGSGASSPSA